jgi:phosphoglycolate phosphatase
MKYKNILLDLDGTVADPFESIGSSILYACEKLGYATPSADQIRKCIGPPLTESLGPFIGVPTERVPEFIDTYREHHGLKGILHYRLYEGMADTLKKLSEHYRLYLATSKPTVYADPILAATGVKKYFSGIVGAELDGSRSHKADIIAHVIKSYSVPVAGSIMIGDRMHDAIGAIKHEMDWAGVLWGFGPHEELSAYSSKALFESQKLMLEFFSR